MAWARNGTPNTLSGTSDDCDITDLTAKKFNVFLFHKIASGQARVFQTFNNNTNNVYAERLNQNGQAPPEQTAINQSSTTNLSNSATHDEFHIWYTCSISGEEKLSIGFIVNGNTAGAGTAPLRAEFVGKFVPSPDADITRIDWNNATGSGDFAADTNASALGTD